MAGKPKPDIEQRSGVTVVSLGPEFETLDEGLVDEVSAVILDAAENAKPPLVVVDLSHTRFFGSAFIEVLFRAWNRLNSEEGGQFCVSGLQSYCREVIQVTHLDRLWTLYETADEAVAAMQPTGE